MTEPSFADLARSSPWSEDEWRDAWDICSEATSLKRFELFAVVSDMSCRMGRRPSMMARALVTVIRRDGEAMADG